jgi:hypothetical protein
MAAAPVQTFANHTRWLPPWHFFAIPVLLANTIIQIIVAVRAPGLDNAWAAVVAIALLLAIVYARVMAVRLQDRVIRLEETLRLERLLPGRRLEIERLSAGQLIGIRFASDGEVPHLFEHLVAGELVTRRDVKRAVQHWRPDDMRV